MAFLNRPNSKFSTTLYQAVSDTISTTFYVNAVPGRFPCVLIIDSGTAAQEKVQATSGGTNSITVVRNYDGNGAYTHTIGATVVDYDSPEYVIPLAQLLEALTTYKNIVTGGLNFTAPSSGLAVTIPSGQIYYSGSLVSIPSDGGHTYTASQDTYVDVANNGTYSYNGVANGAGAPALTANSIRIAKVVTSASAITGVTQSGTDSNSVPIFPLSLIDLISAAQNLTNKSINGNTVPTGTDTVALLAATQTLTNKRITKRSLLLSAGSATPAINTDLYDVVHITAQSAAITSFTSGLTGTPIEGDKLDIDITDNGTAQAITWGTSFESGSATLPTTTVISTRLDVSFVWNVVTSKWRCVAPAAATLTPNNYSYNASANYSTTSSSWVSVDATNTTKSITTSNSHKVRVMASFTAYNGLYACWFQVVRDTTTVVAQTVVNESTNGYYFNIAMNALDNPATGAHTYDLQYKTDAGGTLHIGGTISYISFSLEEVNSG